ncbi:MAG: hypothetical protein DYH12_32710, partial [Sorangiineae bacterium PRO1]|nr:hypothetical protein [Sorangiineae bacterium PRO1]
SGGGGAPSGGGGAPSGGGSPAVDCSCTGSPPVDAGGSGCVRCIDAIYVNLPVTDPKLCQNEVDMYKALRDCVCQKCGGPGKDCAQQLCPPATFDGTCEGCMVTSCNAAFSACNK